MTVWDKRQEYDLDAHDGDAAAEALSAWYDDEADPEEWRRILSAADEKMLRQQVATYALISRALQRQTQALRSAPSVPSSEAPEPEHREAANAPRWWWVAALVGLAVGLGGKTPSTVEESLVRWNEKRVAASTLAQRARAQASLPSMVAAERGSTPAPLYLAVQASSAPALGYVRTAAFQSDATRGR